jgi:ferredoxin
METLKIFLKKSRKTIFFSTLALLFISLTSAVVVSESRPMLIINYKTCIQCGICEQIAPSCFVMASDGFPGVISGWEDYYQDWLDALVACPMGAISYTNY